MKIKLILSGLVFCLSTQSYAIGDVEKGALIGAGSLYLLQQLYNTGRFEEIDRNYVPSYKKREEVIIYREYPRYYAPRYIDRYGREVIIIEKYPYNGYRGYR